MALPDSIGSIAVSFAAVVALGLARCPAAPEGSRNGTAAPSASAPPPLAPVRPSPAPAVLHLTDDADAAAAAPAPAPNASTPSPPRAQSPLACRVVALGDSLTDYRSGGGGYLKLLAQRCPGSTFENWGKGGDMVNQMRRRFESALRSDPSSRYTHFIVWGGVNDLYSDETAGRTPAKIEHDLSLIYGEARSRGARVVAITVAPWAGFTRWFSATRGRATLDLNEWIRGQGDAVVDAYSLLSCGDAERLCAEYEPPFKDGLHIGKVGHERLGEALYEAEFKHCL